MADPGPGGGEAGEGVTDPTAETLPEALKDVELGPPPKVGVVMGSRSDWAVMRATADLLSDLEIPHEVRVVSAHRTPARLVDYGSRAQERGLQVLIAGAGGAAHLPGMMAAHTNLPVLGVPIESKALHGLDSLLSIVQMPAGVPVGTLAIGTAGAVNAGLLAAAILALSDPAVAAALSLWRLRQSEGVPEHPEMDQRTGH